MNPSDTENPDMVTVTFHVWGHPCHTTHDDMDSALKWLSVCYGYGFLQPTCIFKDATVLMDEDDIIEAIRESS